MSATTTTDHKWFVMPIGCSDDKNNPLPPRLAGDEIIKNVVRIRANDFDDAGEAAMLRAYVLDAKRRGMHAQMFAWSDATACVIYLSKEMKGVPLDQAADVYDYCRTAREKVSGGAA